MATLAEAIRARDALRDRYRGASWLRGLSVGLGEVGFGLELRGSAPLRERVDVDPRVLVRIVSEAYAPLCVARWRWSGRPAVFHHLDRNGDGVVDEHDLDRGLGRGVALLRDEAAGPLGANAWEGSAHLFRAFDENNDGRVARSDLEDGLGDHAVRLVHGEPAHGPQLPPGSAYGWRANARWIHFADREAKAKYMSKAARHDAEDPILLGWARQFNRLPVDKRAAAILRFVQRCIRYERDPAWFDAQGTRHGIELLDSAAVGLHRGYGDCDLKARLFVALCLACGVTADIEPVFTGDTGFPHVRARVRRETSETAGERWETADPTIVNSTIGHLPRKALTAFPRETASNEPTSGSPGH
jgi:hypothetical protein